MSAAEEIFNEAAKSFRARLTSKELSRFQGTTLDDLRRLMLHIQSTQELVKNSMSMRRLERFVGGMSELGNILDVFLNNGEILCFIWGPVKFLLGVSYPRVTRSKLLTRRRRQTRSWSHLTLFWMHTSSWG